MPPTAAVGAAQRAELDRELNLVAAAGDRLADEQLVVARAVEVAGIEQGHAALDRGVNDGGALRVVRLAVGAGHSHAAECDSHGERSILTWYPRFVRCACRFLARFLRQECTSAARPEALRSSDGVLHRACRLAARSSRGARDDGVAAHGGEGALRRRAHRARRYRVVGRRQGLALGARLHPGEAARRRGSPPRPPRTDDVHGRHAAERTTSRRSTAKAER